MPAGKHKSKTFRKVFVKTPGGKTIIQHKKRKPSKSKCGSCGAILQGMVRARPRKMQNTSKASKKPSRPYGGNLCSQCMRKKIIEKARAKK